MQRDVNFGIDAVQVVDHGHVFAEVPDRYVPVFRHNQIQSDKFRVGGSQFKAEQNLRKNDLRRQAAQPGIASAVPHFMISLARAWSASSLLLASTATSFTPAAIRASRILGKSEFHSTFAASAAAAPPSAVCMYSTY